MTMFIVGFLTLRVLCIAFIVVLVLRIGSGVMNRHVDSGLVALERRYATGGLGEADFRRMREVLES
ncbi:MAG: hypothetical protein ACLQMF_00380 [Rectinemataceae bacterium]